MENKCCSTVSTVVSGTTHARNTLRTLESIEMKPADIEKFCQEAIEVFKLYVEQQEVLKIYREKHYET